MPKPKTIMGSKPRLKNIDDLFNLNDPAPSDSGLAIEEISIASLKPYHGHIFRLYEGERFEDMVESIKTNGVLVPIIVRKLSMEKQGGADTYEILAGHNRVNAGKAAGLEAIPAIVLDGISDEEAQAYVVETNLIQRSFSDMAHSEKAAAIALHHSKMFSQGKRNDIMEQLRMMEDAHSGKAADGGQGIPDEQEDGGGEEDISSLAGKPEKAHTDKKIGELYGLSKNTVSRYLRINQLIGGLKDLLDEGRIPFVPAVTVSFLSEGEQVIVLDCIERQGGSLDIKKADILRKFSSDGSLDQDSAAEILTGQAIAKPERPQSVKVSQSVYTKYFKAEQSSKEVQAIVEEALEMYFNNHAG